MKTNIGKQLALLVATVVLLATASAAQNDGVVAWWKFNEGSGDFVVDSRRESMTPFSTTISGQKVFLQEDSSSTASPRL